MAVNMSSIMRKLFATHSNISHNLTNNVEATHDNPTGSDEGHNSMLDFLSNQRFLMTCFLLPACLGLSSLSNLKILAPYIALASILMFSTFFLISIVIFRHWEHGFASWVDSGGISIEWSKVSEIVYRTKKWRMAFNQIYINVTKLYIMFHFV